MARSYQSLSSLPRATMRFMPLADIFIGAIACLLILIIVAKKTREQLMEIPHADYVYKCVEQAHSKRGFEERPLSTGQTSTLYVRRLLPRTESQSRLLSLGDFEAELRPLHHPDRLSVRISLVEEQNSGLSCTENVKRMVEKLNRQFETLNARARPSSYFLLDIVRGVAKGSAKESPP